ncbi:acetyl-CoA synthetase-like protein [Ophiobolus disseminans]|uniref:Acetyl-CoA synthetase-like protein n=1 Tax=Ophiobolus disseminans TaxID=1469910 RepID=A0A6A7AL81_9PLEO|nr:acetyl-CoA synthetase-like protein [Ophiobolus disseminans]
MFAILKAGAAFVPMDPSQPVSALSVIAKEVNAKLVVVSHKTAALFEDQAEFATLVVDGIPKDGVSFVPSVPLLEIIALTMSLSGTTGKPTGVIIEHRSMATAAISYGPFLNLNTETRILQASAFIWLPCSVEIIACLIFGGRCCVPSDEDRLNDTAGFINTHQVNTAVMTPTFLSSLTPAEVTSIKVLGIGGEKLPQSAVDAWASHVTLVLAYGSTETNLCMLQHIEPGPLQTRGKVAGSRAWIVDPEDRNRLQSAGEPGELLVESFMLARDYLNDEEKQAQKFIARPAWASSLGLSGNARFCATGDLVRHREDGTIELLGRKDTGVKIRGQKVDPAQLEEILNDLIEKKFPVAVEALSERDSTRLVAFVAIGYIDQPPEVYDEVILEASTITRKTLRPIQELLLSKLPSYLVPSGLIPCQRFPTTPSGKLDRRRLRSIALSMNAERLARFVYAPSIKQWPSTNAQLQLIRIWAALLHLDAESIGVNENFFRVGGDSMKAIRMVSAARRIGMSLTNQQIFKTPTVEALAHESLEAVLPTSSEIELSPFSLLESGTSESLLTEIEHTYSIPRNKIQDLYPCTALQEGMVALSLKTPGAYMVQMIVPLGKDVDIFCLKAACQQVARQNPILRSRMLETTAGPLQAVINEELQWQSRSSLSQYLEFDRLSHMFPGSRLIRLAIIEGGGSDRYLAVTAHHAIMDNWSASLFLRNIGVVYQEAVVPPTGSFGSFIQALGTMDDGTQRQFWSKYLAGSTTLRYPVLPSADYEPHATKVIEQDFRMISSCRTDITAATYLRAAWALCLAQYGGTDDVTFGATLSGRTVSVPLVENILGPTIATMPIRIRIPGTKSIMSFLQHVQAEASEMIPHEQFGLHKIRRLAQTEGFSADFQSHLVVQASAHEEDICLFGEKVKVESWETSSTYAINLECTISRESIELRVQFDDCVISEPCMRLMVSQFVYLVDALRRADADERLETVLTAHAVSPENLTIIHDRNATIPLAVKDCGHDLIYDQSLKSPQSTAIIAHDGELSYRDLDELSSRLARHLIQEKQLAADEIVPIYFEKSMWTTVCMLAIWKAGATWTLLDVSSPIVWIEGVIGMTRARFLLCSSTCAESLDPEMDRIVVDDAAAKKWTTDPEARLPVTEPESTAFVLYTAGSTGTAKAIVHTHQAYLSGLKARQSIMARDQSSRVLQFSSYAFDAVIEDTIPTLLVGGTVCVPSQHECKNELAAYINRMAITHADMTPSVSLIFDAATLSSLEVLTLGGEAVTTAHRDLWVGHVRLINAYGPSEIAITSHTKEVLPGDDISDIGRGVGCLSWVVNEHDHNRLIPLGCVGELLLEGPIVSRGYLNSEGKTAEVFIDNPNWLPESQFGVRRMYKTGDLAVMKPDGSILIRGRKDTQVKIRGQRVELSQVEEFIRALIPEARAVLADVAKLQSADRSDTLITFCIFDEPFDLVKLRDSNLCSRVYSAMKESLPVYMIPTALIPLRHLPRTISGKVDRKHLKQLSEAATAAEVLYLCSAASDDPEQVTECVSTTEKEIQRLFSKALAIPRDRIGRHSRFINLGGDSILAMKLVAIANQEADHIKLTVEKVFRYPTVAELALARETTSDDSGVIPITAYELLHIDIEDVDRLRADLSDLCQCQAGRIQDIYPCSPLQEGIMALSIKTPGLYMSQQVLELAHDVDVEALKTAWETVFRAISLLRTRLVHMPIGLLQIVVEERIDWNPVVDIDTYLDDDRRRFVSTGGPLVRFGIQGSGPSRCLVWSIHHALYDGWTISLIVEAVEKTYRNSRLLAHPRAEYNHFVKYLQSLDQAKQAEYWAEYLKGAATDSAFYPRLPTTTRTPCADCSFDVDMRIPSALPKGITSHTLLQAAWSLVTARHLDSKDIIFGTTRTGRHVPVKHIEDVVGPVFTTMPVRIVIDRASTVTGWLSFMQSQTMEMMPFEHLGLHNIQEINTDTAEACRFNTLIVIQPRQEERIAREGKPVFMNHSVAGDISNFNPYALMIQFTVSSEGSVQVNASFDSRIVDQVQLRRMVFQMSHATTQLLSLGPDALVADIEIISPEDKADIERWNNSGVAPQACQTLIHDLFIESVTRHPEKQAICAWDGKMSYHTLDKLSTGLSFQLARKGVGPETIVPICFEKSKWVAVGMLAVLKAGGAFVLLDPSHPRSRLDSIVKNTRAKLLLASDNHSDLLSSCVDEVLVVSEAEVDAETEDVQSVVARLLPSNLACLVFTSGSSGLPKGIELTHENVSTSALAHGPAMNMTSESRVFQFASHAFDMALYDIITTLIVGGTICIPSEEQKMNHLTATFESLRANWAFLTPSTVSLFRPLDVPSMRTLVVGGESVSQEIMETWVHIVQLYQCSGPAETTTCIAGLMKPKTNKNRLGKGVGTLCWIVDAEDAGFLAPIGAVGELVIEGPTLARGYLNDGRDLSEAFSLMPSWAMATGKAPTRRFYRTGDLVQYNSDGSLNFVGRKDTQIKIRGQRVELNEVEDCLRTKLAGWNLAAEVIVPVDGNRNPALVVFLAAVTGPLGPLESAIISSPAVLQYTDIFQHLSSRLPSYMVPTAIIPITSMPLNTSGKVDRAGLRKLGSTLTVRRLAELSSSSSSPKRKPSRPEEMLLRDLWAECLKLEAESISATDSFLNLGGNSISAMRLVALARVKGMVLTVANIFQNPTLELMAATLDERIARTENTERFSIVSRIGEVDEVLREVAEVLGVQVGAIDDIYQTTPLQEGLMFFSSETPGSYTAQAVYKIYLHVDINRFRAAAEIVHNHTAILRTRILQLASGKTVQAVLRETIRWCQSDHLQRYLEEDQKDCVGMGDRLSRWGLVVEQGQTFFVWTRHHASYDGWSLPLTLQAIEEVYSSGKTHLDHHAPFTLFMKHLDAMDHQDSATFWTKQLNGAPVSKFPELPPVADAQPDSSSSHDVATLEVDMLPSASNGITSATMVRAAWALLAAKYTREEDVVFGETVSGRDAPVEGIEAMLAPTFATIPIRIRFDSREDTVLTLLQSVQRTSIQTIPHQHFGSQNIMRLGDGVRQTCQFSTLISIYVEGEEQATSTLLQPHEVLDHGTFFTHPLTVLFHLKRRSLRIEAHYRETTLSGSQIERVLAQFGHILGQLMTASAEATLDNIDYCSPQDVSDLRRWNKDLPSTVETTIHAIFARQVRTSPDAPAIVTGEGRTLSYAELDRMTDNLAHHLCSLGVLPGDIVPLCFPKSLWFPVSIMAVLKAGCAFLGINPDDPMERVHRILHDANPKVILTAPELASRFGSINTEIVAFDDVTVSDIESACHSHEAVCSPSNAACIVYTSGSTGAPKGVILEHKNICTTAEHHTSALRLSQEDRVLHFASPSWDVVYLEILLPLMVGAAVLVPAGEEHLNDLAGTINRFQATWMFLTPTMMSLLRPSDVPSLRNLVTGGEAGSASTLQIWQDMPGHVHNVYGPSECTVFVITNEDHAWSSSPLHLGRQIASRLWLVSPDDHNRLVPVGCAGELLIEGPLVARGYLNDTVKTEASFLVDPEWSHLFGEENQRRLYKTGDLLRQQEDGSFEFCGRIDHQIKLNGQRLDAGEVENAIRKALPEVKAVTVAKVSYRARENKAALTAFLAFSDQCRPAQSGDPCSPMSAEYFDMFQSLKTKLRSLLPRFMIPSLYVPLDYVPTTSNGKLARVELEKLASTFSEEEYTSYRLAMREKRHPSTAMEEKLRALWASALCISEALIGLDDSFLSVGGDSILAVRLASIARAQGISLTTGTIFRHPRLEDMARHVHRLSLEQEEEEQTQPFALLPAGSRENFLKHAIGSKLSVPLSEIEDVYPATDYQACAVAANVMPGRGMMGYFFFDGDGDVDVDRLKQACVRLVAMHDVFRTTFACHNGKLFQVVHKNMHVPFHVYEARRPVEAACERVCNQELRKDLHQGDVFAGFKLFKQTGTTKHRLVIRMSHAQYDGMCMPHIIETLGHSYREMEPSPRPRFAAYVRESQRQRSPKTYAYWRSLLKGAQMTQILSRVRPAVSSFTDEVRLSRATLPVKTCLPTGVTMASVMKAGWGLTLMELSGQKDVVFASTTAGRSAAMAGIDKVTGACLSIIPVRLQLEGGTSAVDFLQGVQDQQTQGIPHELLGLRETVHKCTDWPNWTNFGSIVQHDDHVYDEASHDAVCTLGEIEYRLSSYGRPTPELGDIAVHSRTKGQTLEIQLQALHPAITEAFCNDAMELLCRNVNMLCRMPEGPFPPPMQQPAARIPLEHVSSPTAVEGTDSGVSVETSSDGGNDSDDCELRAKDIEKTVEAAWGEILGGLLGEVNGDMAGASFFAQGGDIVAVTQLAARLQHGGYAVSPAELVEFCTIEQQMRLLAEL